jgi:3-methylfumaryl-CoA hydratase
MTDIPTPDPLCDWIGRSETASDLLTPRLLQAFDATLDRCRPAPRAGDPVSLGVHWCLAPPCVPASSLGQDGHPVLGGFLPPMQLPRRMWAGGRLTFHDQLLVGDVVERRSTIADVRLKQGRSGMLCFVTVAHAFLTPRGLAVQEQQDIVYRGPALAAGPAEARVTTSRIASVRRTMVADPVLLFRYSALTFNGHRIHYDRPYARDVEAYPDLVVHGPLQATWLIGFAETIRGAPPAGFSFRGLQPLFDTDSFALCAAPGETGLSLWVETADGRATLEAEAVW